MIAGTHADNEGILVGLDAGTYNVRKATCTYYCITCNGWWTALLTGTPFTIPKGSGTTLQLQDQWNTGATYSLSGNYASNNTAVATIGATNGTVNGIAPGSPNFTGTGNDFVYISNYCAVDPICNSRSSPQGSGGGTVVSATISQRTSSTVSSDDAALSSYQNAVGTTNLGNIIENGNVRGCGIGLETIGSVAPSNYTGSVIMHRTIVNQGHYVNSTDAGGGTPANTDDTSPSNFRDDNPQSGGSAGKVYDLDGPGLHPSAVDGKTYRYRTNFSAYATLSDGTLISPSPGFFFYVRLSCQLTGPGYVFINDVPGDNQIGIGTTNTTWNLQ